MRQRYREFKKVKVGVEKYFASETKPKYKWLDSLLTFVFNKLINLAWRVFDMNTKYNRVEYQVEKYRDVFEERRI